MSLMPAVGMARYVPQFVQHACPVVHCLHAAARIGGQAVLWAVLTLHAGGLPLNRCLRQ